MQHFGTDGVRGEINKTLTSKLLKQIAKAVVFFFNKHKLPKVLLVGNDGRESGNYILAIMQTIFLKNGIETHNIEECSSPCLAYTTHKFGYPLGMMISASHNPYQYNGIKFFNCKGEKISEQTEQELESYMNKRLRFSYIYARARNKSELKQNYINYLKLQNNSNIPCIIDCAYGGTTQIVKQVFLKTKTINDTPNGTNINKNAGSTKPEMLKKICQQENKIGFALDGDGDRIVMVCADGQLITGDKILYILATNILPSSCTIVGTIYSNEGLNQSLKSKGYNFVRAGVGDKLVYQQMQKLNCSLGGENSGHIILKPYQNTGDGLLIVITLLNILSKTQKTIKELLTGYNSYTLLEQSIPNSNTSSPTPSLKKLIKNYEAKNTRIIIRPSGTEPVLRLLVEHKNKEIASTCLAEIINNINKSTLNQMVKK